MSLGALSTTVGPAMPFERAEAPRARATTWSVGLTGASVGFCLPIFWAFGHAFVGVEGDAKIYMGRALADFDPFGVGRDLMFAHDGQSSFSLYRELAAALAGWLGFGPTVALLSILALAVWFGAAATFARTFAREQVQVLVLAAVCLLPRTYSPWGILGAGEAIAVPRPLAEACVLLALAALERRCHALCALCLLAGGLIHPIMTLPAVGVLLAVDGLRHRRWIVVAAAGAVAVAAAALCGVPIVARLALTLDPLWRGVLLERNPYLFPHLWPLESIGLFAVQAATIIVGAAFLEPRARCIFLAALAVGAAGVAASLLLGDVFANVLVVQAQLWRALWLPAVLAPMAAGLCLWHLPHRGNAGHVTLAALCVAWLTIDEFPIGLGAAVLALSVHVSSRTIRAALGRPSVPAAWSLAAVFAALTLWTSVRALAAMYHYMPDGLRSGWTLPWAVGLPIIPVLLLVSAWRLRPDAVAARLLAPAAALIGVALLAACWDIRTPARRDLDAATVKPDLTAKLSSRAGGVLWLDGDEVWAWARRGNWNGLTQGGSMVFSRELAILWRVRTQAMIEDGLATSHMLDPWRNPQTFDPLALRPDLVRDFCRRPEAPAWIAAPLEPGASVPASLGASVWRPGMVGWRLLASPAGVRWHHHDRYALIPCGGTPR